MLRIQPDIVHLHSSFPGVYGRIFKYFPTIYCAHGWSFAQNRSVVKQFLFALVERVLAKKTDAIIHVSRNERCVAYQRNVTARLNPVILSGVVRHEEKSESLANIHIDKEAINIGFVGRLDYAKGFDIIEPVFRQASLGNVRLYVIGESDQGQVKKYKHCRTITYLGWVAHDQVDWYIREFDAIIIPSRYEGFALTPLEAMRNAKPVIVSNKTSLSEVVIEGYNGYIFDLDYAEEDLKRLFEKLDKKTLREKGQKARHTYLSCFTFERCAGEVETLYKDILDAGNVK